VKLSLCMPWRRIEGVEVYTHSFLTSAVGRAEWSSPPPHLPGLFIPGKEPRYPLEAWCGFFWIKTPWLMLAAHLHPEPRLRMSGALPLQTTSWRGEGQLIVSFTRHVLWHNAASLSYMPQKCSEEASNKLEGFVLAWYWPLRCHQKTAWNLQPDFLNGRQIKEEVWQGIGGMDYDAKQPADRMLPPSCSPHNSVQSLLAAAPTSDPVSGLTLLLLNEYSR
jgi:hypothetical protein